MQESLSLAQCRSGKASGAAGLMARSVADIQFLDTIFSQCPRNDSEIDLQGYRIGYPREWWHDIGDEVGPVAHTPC